MILTDHQKQYLENVSVEYENEELIGHLLFPPVPVKTKSDDVAVFGKKSQQIWDAKRGVDGRSTRIRDEYESETYNCENYALHDFVTNKRIRNADVPIEPLVRCNQNVTNAVLLAREARSASKAFTPGNHAASQKMDIGTDYAKWDLATTDIYEQILEGKEKCDKDPNVLVLGRQAWFYFRKAPKIRELVSGGSTIDKPGIIRLDGLNNLLEIEYIAVGKAWYDSTPKQATRTKTNLWGTSALLAYTEAKPSLDMFSYGFMPVWTENGGTDGYKLNSWEDLSIYGGATFVEVEEDVDEFVICPTAACLLHNLV